MKSGQVANYFEYLDIIFFLVDGMKLNSESSGKPHEFELDKWDRSRAYIQYKISIISLKC